MFFSNMVKLISLKMYLYFYFAPKMPPIILITRSTASNRYKYYMCVYFTLMQVLSVIDRKNDTRLRVDVLDRCLSIPLTGFAFDIHKNEHFLEFKRFLFTIYLINMILKFILLKQ